jgi:hypothetical protein
MNEGKSGGQVIPFIFSARATCVESGTRKAPIYPQRQGRHAVPRDTTCLSEDAALKKNLMATGSPVDA